MIFAKIDTLIDTLYPLLTNYMVFSQKHRGKILTDDVALVTEGIIRKTCSEMDIQIIDLAISIDHIHPFIKYPPKYSVSLIVLRINDLPAVADVPSTTPRK